MRTASRTMSSEDQQYYNLIAEQKWEELGRFLSEAGRTDYRGSICYPIRATQQLKLIGWRKLAELQLLGPSERLLEGFVRLVAEILGEYEEAESVWTRYYELWGWLYMRQPTARNWELFSALSLNDNPFPKPAEAGWFAVFRDAVAAYRKQPGPLRQLASEVGKLSVPEAAYVLGSLQNVDCELSEALRKRAGLVF